ncbi:hypothetical protein ACP275_14G054400 [Erythranthe tilingii]
MATTHSHCSFSCILVVISVVLVAFLHQTAGELARHNRTPTTKEKLSHLRMYWHDVVSGRYPTSVTVVNPPARYANGFGAINMIDNPLTLGPDPRSEAVGKAQGFYAMASQEETGLLMTMNFVFTRGKYNGSTITILGRNAVLDKVREMPVIGGSGLFRFGRGYAEARTNKFDTKTGDATVEYNVYVMHY